MPEQPAVSHGARRLPTDLRVPWQRVPTQTCRRTVSQPKPACPQPQEPPADEPRQPAAPGGGRTSAGRRWRRNGGDRHGGLGADLRGAAAVLRCPEGSWEGVVVVDMPSRLRARVTRPRILQTPPELPQHPTTTRAGDQPARRRRTVVSWGRQLASRTARSEPLDLVVSYRVEHRLGQPHPRVFSAVDVDLGVGTATVVVRHDPPIAG
jgi:hypothetical protein